MSVSQAAEHMVVFRVEGTLKMGCNACDLCWQVPVEGNLDTVLVATSNLVTAHQEHCDQPKPKTNGRKRKTCRS